MGILNPEKRAWLGELYDANYVLVFKTCSGLLGNPDDAADASQEVFLIAANSLQPGTTCRSARAWLQTVARNHCLDILRRRKRLGKVLATIGVDDDGVGDVAGAVATRDLVDTIFKRLSPVERQVLWQSAVEHRAITDIAGRLQLSYMAAAQVIHRARRHAFELAARIAIVVGAVKLSERFGRASLAVVRVAAVPIIAVAAVSLQTSSSPTAVASGRGPAVVESAGAPTALPGGSGQSSPAPAASPVAGQSSDSTSQIISAAGAVQQQIGGLPLTGTNGLLGRQVLPGSPVPVPSPSLPAVPTAVPSPSSPRLP